VPPSLNFKREQRFRCVPLGVDRSRFDRYFLIMSTEQLKIEAMALPLAVRVSLAQVL
jgi:hypothetical protein